MPTEILVAVIVFIGMLAISVFGYWSATRRSDAIDRLKRDPTFPAYDRGVF